MISVERDGAYLVFKRDAVEFYDTAIPAPADACRLIRHLSDKSWFADVKQDTIRIINAADGDQ
jgi:hypothetical protein